jgi:predicted amidophosphoribosyltransferase
MSLRRCPACRNVVERESETCPICGRTFAQAVVSRALPWTALALLLFWTVHHFHAMHFR